MTSVQNSLSYSVIRKWIKERSCVFTNYEYKERKYSSIKELVQISDSKNTK